MWMFLEFCVAFGNFCLWSWIIWMEKLGNIFLHTKNEGQESRKDWAQPRFVRCPSWVSQNSREVGWLVVLGVQNGSLQGFCSRVLQLGWRDESCDILQPQRPSKWHNATLPKKRIAWIHPLKFNIDTQNHAIFKRKYHIRFFLGVVRF